MPENPRIVWCRWRSATECSRHHTEPMSGSVRNLGDFLLGCSLEGITRSHECAAMNSHRDSRVPCRVDLRECSQNCKSCGGLPAFRTMAHALRTVSKVNPWFTGIDEQYRVDAYVAAHRTHRGAPNEKCASRPWVRRNATVSLWHHEPSVVSRLSRTYSSLQTIAQIRTTPRHSGIHVSSDSGSVGGLRSAPQPALDRCIQNCATSAAIGCLNAEIPRVDFAYGKLWVVYSLLTLCPRAWSEGVNHHGAAQ